MSSSITLDQGSTAYIASRYAQSAINTANTLKKNDPFDAAKWINGVSLPPAQVPACSRCQLDTTAFDPAVVSLVKYETKIDVNGKRPAKGEYAECTRSCLWYPFFSEQRRIRQQEWQRVEAILLEEEKKRYAVELKRKQAEEAELAAKQKVAKTKVTAAAKIAKAATTAE
jgi:hypothetical protein